MDETPEELEQIRREAEAIDVHQYRKRFRTIKAILRTERFDIMHLQGDILESSGGTWDDPPAVVEWQPEHFERARGRSQGRAWLWAAG